MKRRAHTPALSAIVLAVIFGGYELCAWIAA